MKTRTQTPACREVSLSVGQGSDAMQLIGQHGNGIDIEWIVLFDAVKGLAEQLDSLLGFEEVLATVSDNGEEVACTGRCDAAVLHEIGLSGVSLG